MIINKSTLEISTILFLCYFHNCDNLSLSFLLNKKTIVIVLRPMHVFTVKGQSKYIIYLYYAYYTTYTDLSIYFFLSIRWYHVLDENEPTLLETGSGTRVLGQVLSIEAVRPENAGTYRCSASNDAGQTSADTRLDVVVPLQVQVRHC